MNVEKTLEITGSAVMCFALLLRTFLPDAPEYLIVSVIIGCTGYIVLCMSIIAYKINKKEETK
jgi:hypothetical protein